MITLDHIFLFLLSVFGLTIVISIIKKDSPDDFVVRIMVTTLMVVVFLALLLLFVVLVGAIVAVSP